VNAIAGQLQSLNAVYEVQLNALQAQAEAYKAQTAQVEALTKDVTAMVGVVGEALKSNESYAAGTKQLAGQVADLNKVYGNMLNALV
jgi:uncharacterized protein YukE